MVLSRSIEGHTTGLQTLGAKPYLERVFLSVRHRSSMDIQGAARLLMMGFLNVRFQLEDAITMPHIKETEWTSHHLGPTSDPKPL